MKICVLLPYANPHTTGWIDEFISTSEHSIFVGIVNSVQKYRRNHFEDADNKKGYFYFFKDRKSRFFFYQHLRNCEYLITLGMFEPWFFKTIFFTRKIKKIYVLSEPFRPANKKKLMLRKLYLQIIKCFKRSSKFSILCMGGSLVKEQYLSFGFHNSDFFQFGHFPILQLTKKMPACTSVLKFIFVGKLIPRKGIDILISAINYLQQKYVQWEFAIIGNGTGTLKNELLRNCEGDHRIQYIENIGDTVVMKSYFDRSHILFLPSYFDGWGAVVNEALSSCCSLLLSEKVYAGEELLIANENGFKFNPYEIGELYHFIDKYFNNPEILNKHFNRSNEIFLEWNHKNAAISFDNMLNGKANLQNKTLLKVV